MEASFMDDEEGVELYKDAKNHIAKANYIEALVILEDLLSVHGEDKNSWCLLNDQGEVFLKLAETTEGTDMEITYLLASVECFRKRGLLSPICAFSLQRLALKLGSVFYYKKCVKKAREGLFVNLPGYTDPLSLEQQNLMCRKNDNMQNLIKDAEFKIAESKTSSIQNCEVKVWESKKSPEPLEDQIHELRSYWVGLDVKVKRDFMKVSIAKLTSFVEGVYFREGRHVLEQVLASAREDRKWTFWMCRTLCSKKISNAEKCMNHLEQQHAADFKPSSEKDMVKRIGKDWARKILVGDWEPVDTVAAVELINNQLANGNAFAAKNGWSREWPLAADVERSKLLKEIKLLLVSFCDRKILSCSIRDWVMRFPIKHLEKLEVSEQSLVDFHLVETPQSICFLECHELNQILDFLKNIKCERDDGTDLVCRAVDSFLGRIRVKENIDFDPQFSFLLLDKRLLKTNNAPFDDEETINVFDPNVHYAKAHAQGDDIISWLTDYNSVDKTFPRPIREHNLDLWMAILRAVQFTCTNLGTKYAKKVQVLDYDAALTVIENLCMSEDERRKNLQENQWNRYASLLCDRCEERVPENSLTTKLFLCAVQDVLKGALHPSFDLPSLEDCMHLIRDRKNLSDDIVLKSIDHLKSVVTQKVLRIDSKILLIDNTRISLLKNLTRLSVFDNRNYILQVLKPFLLNEIVNMKSKAKSDAAEADLLLEEGKKSQSKKKKNKSKKRTSSSKSCPLDKTVEHEPSTNLEPEGTSTSLKMLEEDSMEAEDTLASERGRLEISSNTDNQNEATKVDPGVQNITGADLLLEEEKKSQSKKKKNKSKKRTSSSKSCPRDKTVEHEPSANLEPEGTSPSLKMVVEDAMEAEDTLASERGRLEISSNTDNQKDATKVDPDIQNMSGEDPLGEAAARYNSALDMTLKALLKIKVLKDDLMLNKEPYHGQLEEQVPSSLQNLFTAFASEVIKTEGVYSCLFSDFLASLEQVLPMSNDAAEVLVAILEFWHCWKNPERESLVTRLFTLEENERMSCRKCRRITNYPEQSSYGIVMAADSIRELKCAFGNITFVDILKVIRMEHKMLCGIKTGGCGKTHFVQHTSSRCPPIFTIVLEWEKSENEKEISETTKELDGKIDISRLYKGLEPNTIYRLVSMVGCGEEEEEHICIAYEKNRWVNLRRESLAGEDVGKWKSVVRFCEERKIRPKILFYEAARTTV